MNELLTDRKLQIHETGTKDFAMECEKHSLAGAVSQRACVFCGSRVVLYPVTDALHLVHGPIGCAAYTWDIRGALSSDRELHRMSFCTDLREINVIYGGEEKLYQALTELITLHKPAAAFIYSTCIVGVIGDDVEAIALRVEREQAIPVIAVHSEGFKGTKKDGYKAACDALGRIVGTDNETKVSDLSINIMGDFNIAGEIWEIKDYYKEMGIEVVSTVTGDAKVSQLRKAHKAKLNVVQCSGSMMHLAKDMEEKYGIPFIRVSYFGLEDMSKALYDVAEFFGDADVLEKTKQLVLREVGEILPELINIRKDLEGKRAAVYTGGAFKAFSLVHSLRTIGIQTVIAGSQTGSEADYKELEKLCDVGTVLIDDANPMEISKYVQEKDAHLLIGGVKERPIAYKLGLGFCDHNHERKVSLAGFRGMLNFAKEVHSSIMSPVWKYARYERN